MHESRIDIISANKCLSLNLYICGRKLKRTFTHLLSLYLHSCQNHKKIYPKTQYILEIENKKTEIL